MNWSNLLYLQHQLLTPGLATQTQAVKFDADTEEALTTLGEQSPEETLQNLPTDLTLSNLPAESLDTVGDSSQSEEVAYPLFLRLDN